MNRILPTVLTLLISTATCCCAQIADSPEGITPQQRKTQLVGFANRELTLELIRVGSIVDLPDDQRVYLHGIGKPVSERVGKRRAKNSKAPVFILRNFPATELSSVLSKELAKRSGKKAADQYDQDVKTRIAFFDQAYSNILLVLLDQQVSLTPEQIQPAIEEIKKLPGFRYTHPHIHAYDWAWGITPPPDFVEHKFKCLSDNQARLWSKRAELLRPLLEPGEQLLSGKAEAIQNRCRMALDSKVRILAEQYELNPSQLGKLRLLAKRVTRDLPEQVTSAYKLRETSMVKPEGGGWAMPLRERIPIFELIQMTDLFDLIECRTDWRKWVRSVLNEEQRVAFDARHAQRVKHNHAAQWRCWVVSYSLRLGLTAKQEQALF